MPYFEKRSSIVPNMNAAMNFLVAGYAVIYDAYDKESGTHLRRSMSDFGTRSLRWVHNQMIKFGGFEDVKLMKEESEIHHYASSSNKIIEHIEHVRILVTAAVNDKWFMATDVVNREAAMTTLKKAAGELEDLIIRIENPE